MTSLNVSLPKTLKKYVEAQVKEGGYSTPSEYVRALVREDQKSKAEEKLETMLLEGLNSGQPLEVTPEFWKERRRELLKRLQKKSRR